MVRPKGKIERAVFSTRLNPEHIKKLKYLAVDVNRSLNDLIEEAIEDLLKKYPGKKK
jgi:predicted transcriptional regulator